MVELEVKKSKLHGRGVYTKENISKGETIFIIKGHRKHLVVKGKKESDMGPAWVGIKHGEWIDPTPPALYLNHSCNPNAGIKGAVTLKALRNIKSGEEITFDYATTEDDVYWQMKCGCGSKNCRKIVRSVQFLPEKQFKSYLPYIPTFFKDLYSRKVLLRKSFKN